MLNDGSRWKWHGCKGYTYKSLLSGGCPGSATYGAYLYLNGDANDSLTNYAQRSAGQKLHSVNMSYGGSGGSPTSASCVKLGELADKGVLIASSSGNSELDQLVGRLHVQKYIQ